MGTGSTPLRSTADAGAERAPRPAGAHGRPTRALWAIAALTAVGVLVLLLLLRPTAEERALTRLPPAERGALYRRTLANVRTVCAGERAQELHDFCRAQAQLVLLFPECDDACQATAREQLRVPTR